jgi:Cdc6-like AAA superfamily ATPase
MNEPRLAPVRPRVLPLQGTTPLLLNEEIQSFVEAKVRGNIAITGSTGSGKTTALEDVAAALPSEVFDELVVLLDEPSRCQLSDKPRRLVIYTSCRCFPDLSHLAV